MDGRDDNGLDEDMPFDDDDDMSDETNSDEGSDDDNDDDDRRMLEVQQLERNNPVLLNFSIDKGYNPPSCGWEVLGESIGRNTMLKELYIDYEPLSELGMRFFRGLAKNRSIKELTLYCRSRACGEILLYLTPFFMNNKSFESLDISYFNCSNVPSEGRFDSLEYVLEQFNGLKELKFYADGSTDGADKVIKALSSHTGLRELHLSGIGKEGFSSLAAMLLKPSCSLSKLSLEYQFDIDDEMANILSSGLNGNGTLTELDISSPFGHRSTRKFTALGWKTIFVSLKSPACMIHTLNLSNNHISDTALPFLVSACKTIKDLNLNSVKWNNALLQAMLQFLQSPSCLLESINLTANNFDDEKIESLTNALANNCRLRKLVLRCSTKVTPAGWHTLFQLLQRPSCGLDSLDIGACDLTDETVQSLTSTIANGSRLRELDLSCNSNVSPTAWQVLIIALRLHAPGLEILGLSHVHSDLTTSLTDLLADNHKLKTLRILDPVTALSASVVSTLTRVLNDTSSILNTYNSNHVVEELDYEDWGLPAHFSSLLRINKENSPSQAARIKIINAHFSGSYINTQVFNRMELSVYPIAIAWMGGSKTNDLLFTFLRNLPSVCDTTRKIKKRKAVDEV
jgi:hypothetical protein